MAVLVAELKWLASANEKPFFKAKIKRHLLIIVGQQQTGVLEVWRREFHKNISRLYLDSAFEVQVKMEVIVKLGHAVRRVLYRFCARASR